MALTAVEILEHPAFESVIWDLKPTKKGTCTVAKARGSPVNIAYETHGDGLIRLVVGGRSLSFQLSVPYCTLSLSTLDVFWLSKHSAKFNIVDNGTWSLQMVLATSNKKLRT